MSRRALACIGVAAALCSSARANAGAGDDSDGFLHRMTTAISARLAAVVAARTPKLVPPVPIEVKWRPQRIAGSVDLGQVVAIAAADLDGDHHAELYAVTPREVIALSIGGGRFKEIGRVAFGAELAVAAPRDVVGAAIEDGGAIVACVSTRVRGVRVRWRGKQLVAEPGEPGLAPCVGAELVRGHNYFTDGAGKFYSTRRREDLVDDQGRKQRVAGRVTLADTLEVTIVTHAAGDELRNKSHEVRGVGVAFELADVDRDGRPEAIVSGAGAPGDPDHVAVITLGSDDKKPMYRHEWKGGVVGVVAADVDGDGRPCVIVAVRLAGANRVDLWRLN